MSLRLHFCFCFLALLSPVKFQNSPELLCFSRSQKPAISGGYKLHYILFSPMYVCGVRAWIPVNVSVDVNLQTQQKETKEGENKGRDWL